jgi:hypothetical protein
MNDLKVNQPTQENYKHIYPHKDLDVSVHSGIIHCRPSEAIPVSRQTVVYPYTGILFSHEKHELLTYVPKWMNPKHAMLIKRICESLTIEMKCPG